MEMLKDEILPRLEEIYCRDEIDESAMIQIEDAVSGVWKETKYSEEDVLNFMVSIDFSFNADMNMVDKFFRSIGIIITPKDRKKGRKGIVNRLVKKYHKKEIQEAFYLSNRYFFRKPLAILEKDPSLENIKDCVEEYDFEVVYWIARCGLKDEQIIEELKNNYLKDYLEARLKIALGFYRTDFEKVIEKPEELKDENKQLELLKIRKENEKLKRTIGKKNKEALNLKHELHQTIQEKKQLKGTVYELEKTLEESYEDALLEIEQLKKQIEKLEKTFEKEREMYFDMMTMLTKKADGKNGDNKKIKENIHYDLNGGKISVIGGSKVQHYRKIVEKYNGQISFVSSNDYKLIKGSVSESIAVFFLKELVKHPYFYEAISVAKELDKPFIFVNTKGVSTFERELQSFLSKIS